MDLLLCHPRRATLERGGRKGPQQMTEGGRKEMKKFLGLAGLFVGLQTAAMAALTAPTPEIDGATASSAVALLSGAIVVLRSRRRR